MQHEMPTCLVLSMPSFPEKEFFALVYSTNSHRLAACFANEQKRKKNATHKVWVHRGLLPGRIPGRHVHRLAREHRGGGGACPRGCHPHVPLLLRTGAWLQSFHALTHIPQVFFSSQRRFAHIARLLYSFEREAISNTLCRTPRKAIRHYSIQKTP